MEELKGGHKQKESQMLVLAARIKKDKTPLIDLKGQQSLTKMLRVVAFVKRFVSLLRTKKKPSTHYITTDEYCDAMNFLILEAQRWFYADELQILSKEIQVKKTSSIVRLYPFLYEGLLYVGGRLAHSNLPDSKKYQRIIPQGVSSLDLSCCMHIIKHCTVVRLKRSPTSEHVSGYPVVVISSVSLF